MNRDDQAHNVEAKRLFPRCWLSEATPRPAGAYLIKNLIDEGATVVVYGETGCGKTFLVADMVGHLAAGLVWRGRRVKAGVVVYIAAEAGESILRRFVAWRDRHIGDARSDDVPLAIVTRGANLLDDVEAAELLGALRSIAEEAGKPIKLVVIDTLSRSIPGGDENSAHDMSRVVAFADSIRAEIGAATLIVHHAGKTPGKGARGHSALVAAADTVIGIADHVATVEKVRDGVAGEQFPFELEVVNMGSDEEGDAVTTCVVRHLDIEPVRAVPKKAPTGKNQKVVFDALRLLIAERGETVPGTSAIPAGARVVSFTDLADLTVPKFPGIPGWRAKDRIGQVLVSLQGSGLVGVHNERVWVW